MIIYDVSTGEGKCRRPKGGFKKFKNMLETMVKANGVKTVNDTR